MSKPWTRLVAPILIVLWFSFAAGMFFSTQIAHSAALRANAAHYDAKTGDLVYGCKEVAGE